MFQSAPVIADGRTPPFDWVAQHMDVSIRARHR